MLSRISLDLRSLDLQPLLYFSNSPHEWQVESIGKVDEIVLFLGRDKILIAPSANGIALIGSPSEVRKMISAAQWISLA